MQEQDKLIKRKITDWFSGFSLKGGLYSAMGLSGAGFLFCVVSVIVSNNSGLTSLSLVIAAAVFIALDIFFYFLMHFFLSPFQQATAFTKALCQNDPLDEQSFPDFPQETGGLMGALKEYHANIHSRLLQQEKELENFRQEEQQRSMSEDLEDEIQKQASEEYIFLKDLAGQTKTNFYKMADAIDIELQNNITYITEQAGKASSIATQLTTSSNFVGERTGTVAEEATQALDNVHSVEQSADRLNEAVGIINGHIKTSSKLTAEAVNITNQTKDTFNRMEKAASGIEQIIHLISDIASQTNLLALNATIEAARAGEAGKGFAVVASEVKGLANQTTQSITEITDHVKGIQDIVGSAVMDIDKITQSIDSVQHSADEIMGEVGRQSEATQDIADNLVQAHQSVKTVASGITEISGEAKSNMTVAQDIHAISETLATQVSAIRDNLLDIVNKSLRENETRSHERFNSKVMAAVNLAGHDELLAVSIVDYSRSGIQMEIKNGLQTEGITDGIIELEEAGFGVRFKTVNTRENFIHAEYDDDQDMANMFFDYVQSKDPTAKMEDSLEEVELFG